MMTPLVIEPSFCGPPDSGNGGYVCGLIADRLGGQAEITLRAPAPLATPMTVESGAGDSVRVLHGRTLVAEGTRLPVSLDVDLPQPVPVGEARGAGARSRLRTHPDEHPFPSCRGWPQAARRHRTVHSRRTGSRPGPCHLDTPEVTHAA